MNDTDPKNHLEISSFPIHELFSKHENDEDVRDLVDSPQDRRSIPFTRDVVERLINRLEEV